MRSVRVDANVRHELRQENEMGKAQVICWKYSDGSGCGVVRVYENVEAAEKDLSMLREHCQGMKDFELVETEYSDD